MYFVKQCLLIVKSESDHSRVQSLIKKNCANGVYRKEQIWKNAYTCTSSLDFNKLSVLHRSVTEGGPCFFIKQRQEY